jgi:hypothetical protein
MAVSLKAEILTSSTYLSRIRFSICCMPEGRSIEKKRPVWHIVLHLISKIHTCDHRKAEEQGNQALGFLFILSLINTKINELSECILCAFFN